MDPFQKNPAFLDAFREGHPQALEAVYRAFERPLKNFVVRGFAFRSEGRELYFGGLSHAHDLEDIVQETFRRAFGVRARQSYDGVRPYKNYLFTIARNAVITDMSSRRRQIPVGEALMRDAPHDDLSPLESWVVSQRAAMGEGDAMDSHDQVENLEIYGLLMGFVESLTAEEATFFRLRFLAGCSQENTARRMGWNRARVRKLEARLRRAFLCHASGSGYLEARADARRVRRADDPLQHQHVFARARAIYRERRALEENEFLLEAA
ncbi:MAG: sigma-70 family RNA polymerase sigma factor [Myxococcales bacterium]|nr:sigma-70 family RNA polymerase sigma factor [Myxococcales bacterium]MCB9646074.1 sigma-70 family RNA polymerase sigma factor [Deltaproteobacteria bacterium]